MMHTLIPVGALVLAFGAGAAAAAIAPWPAACSSNSCVNSHLNDLNARLKALDTATFSKTVVVTDEYVLSDGNQDRVSTVVPCGTPDPTDDRPFRGMAVSGGVHIGGANAEQWQITSSGPPNAMNSWPVDAYNPHYVPGDPLPSITVFAVCLK